MTRGRKIKEVGENAPSIEKNSATLKIPDMLRYTQKRKGLIENLKAKEIDSKH